MAERLPKSVPAARRAVFWFLGGLRSLFLAIGVPMPCFTAMPDNMTDPPAPDSALRLKLAKQRCEVFMIEELDTAVDVFHEYSEEVIPAERVCNQYYLLSLDAMLDNTVGWTLKVFVNEEPPGALQKYEVRFFHEERARS